MDSQGRKVVVCDNGTGVSARQGGRGSHRCGGDRSGSLGPLAPGPAPLGARAVGARGCGAALPTSADLGSELAGPGPNIPEPATPAAPGQGGGRCRRWQGIPPAARRRPAPCSRMGNLAKGLEG